MFDRYLEIASPDQFLKSCPSSFIKFVQLKIGNH